LVLLNRKPLEKNQAGKQQLDLDKLLPNEHSGKGREGEGRGGGGSMATASFCAASPKIRKPFCQCWEQVNQKL